MNDLLEKSLIAAIEAGKEILNVYETEFAVEYKNDRSPLTEADTRANTKIIELLSPFGIPFLTEETDAVAYEERKNWTRVWIIDPLDGTKEFVKRNGEFTVNIALAENGKPILGVIYSPVFKFIYFASKEIGSFKVEQHDVLKLLNDNNFSYEEIMKHAVRLPIEQKKSKYTVVASRSHLNSETHAHIEKLKKEKGEIELINSGSSIKICLVAEGRADEYPRFGPTMEWDTCAGQAIVEMAGKNIIDLKTNQPIVYNREELLNNPFMVR
jgi:3'(2'), 5'-bisphosphate nucleotidase